jgi:hypothetical protein
MCVESAKSHGFRDFMVDLVGIEPTTSSMPWKRAPSCATGPREGLSYSQGAESIRQRTEVPCWSASKGGGGSSLRGSGPIWQPPEIKMHRPGHMSFPRLSMALLGATLCWSVSAQSAVPAADSANSVSGTLRPALSQVGQSVGSLSIKRWKAPNEVRSEADQDVSSIQHDLNGTLAGLLQQADAAPGSVPAAFAVYRNVDALYDTLLRVVLTANLAAPDQEATALQAALTTLESARSALGQTILNSSQAQETELTRIRMALAKAAATQRTPTTTTVVDDGPADKSSAKKPKTSTTKKPGATATKPASSSSGSPAPQ